MKDKDQELLLLSRLVFELSQNGDTDPDLTLERLLRLLQALPHCRVQAQGAILLRNRRGGLIQIAQHGLIPPWLAEARMPMPFGDGPAAAWVGTPAAVQPPLRIPGLAADAACFILPLRERETPLGLVLLRIADDWQPSPIDVEFMSDLAGALSSLLCRHILNETLRVREVELEEARADAIRRLGTASEFRDNETGMHIMRMTHFATSIARALGLPVESRELLALCAPMHDVGKIGIPDAILLKPGPLTPEERAVMQSHTEIGRDLLSGDDLLIRTAREIAACHHERWDGTGYPAALAGEAIPLLARICAVSDVFDALTSQRPYKAPWPLAEAVAWIEQQSGSHFDPAVVAAFLAALPEIRRIRELYRDDIIDPGRRVELPPALYRDSDWVRWDASLNIGIDVIDEHHRYLFDLVNDLFEVVAGKHGSREVARVLKAFALYAQVHFRAEERMMAHYGYGGLAQQQHEHREFEARLRDFAAELHENPLTVRIEALLYLRDWLLHHIRSEDAGLRRLIDETHGAAHAAPAPLQ